jgi:hypothetical protein
MKQINNLLDKQNVDLIYQQHKMFIESFQVFADLIVQHRQQYA